MKDGGFRAGELSGFDAVLSHGEEVRPCAIRFVDFADLIVGWILQGVEAVSSKDLHVEAVNVFGAGTNQDLLRGDVHPAAPRQVSGKRAPQFFAAAARRRVEDFSAVVGKDGAHRPGKGGEGKEIPFPFVPELCLDGRRRFPFMRTGRGIGRVLAVRHVASASFPRLDVAFLGQERERMLDGDDARPFLVCNAPLGGYLRPVVIDTPCDRIAQVHIQLHVSVHFPSFYPLSGLIFKIISGDFHILRFLL